MKANGVELNLIENHLVEFKRVAWVGCKVEWD